MVPALVNLLRRQIIEAHRQKLSAKAWDQKAEALLGYIPFKATATGRRGGIWAEKFQQWQSDRDEFDRHYHMRSNIEAAIMMMKSKFGDGLKSKTETAMRNEALAKVLCHNLYVLIRCICRFGVGTGFLAACFQKKITEDADD
jgi:transposase